MPTRPRRRSADPDDYRTGLDDLRTVLRQGPATACTCSAGGAACAGSPTTSAARPDRDDVACLVALNVPGGELGLHLGVHDLAWQTAAQPGAAGRPARPDRLIVPFSCPDLHPEED